MSGVPKGSILGPLLFTCFVADLPKHVKTSCLSYADDVKIFHRISSTADAHALQADLDRLSLWSKTWHLKLNPAKCKTITFTLRSSPHLNSYTLDGHQLDRCVNVRDLGVILDTKLTFADHIDATVSKSNRMLGLLMRSMQLFDRERGVPFNCVAALAAYKAHVRSVMEYGCVIWSGAAVTHLRRLERLQHRFLMWLGYRTQAVCPPLDYVSLLKMFGCESVKSRFTRCDISYMRSVFGGRLDCPDIVAMFSVSAPYRRTRCPELFHVPRGRVDTVNRGFLIRLPRVVNSLVHSHTDTDFFMPSWCITADIAKFADAQGTYLS